ncbi:MAG: AbrB/MazE/SpoVT family DNA-binding domain-containing protein [Coriobacteriia bacterium]|nr:AbrB/MazE/SpoVT family DNA-binding domain-containing protein [Coriobacteriia bacterium]MCL2750668.1 AbrB/MazE/SpoVT family DNA-binding domain-containing protein [Coriobacteriia bacterium]
MSTTIAPWGNSEAIRLPKEQLRIVGLERGDEVELLVNERGNLEIVPKKTYRSGRRRRKVTFDELFKDYDGTRQESQSPWADDALVGAEKDAWS